ncbi:MAG: hypothetical protein OXE46_11560 [Chloroflexi bacterium]|nr:hypothetical protein [Chloroflexota bacterium]
MFKRMSILLAMLFIGVLAVAADSVHCGDLTEADCQILIDNSARMHELSAFHFEAEFDLEMRGDASQDNVKLGMIGSGDLAMDAAAAEGIDGMAEQAEALIASLVGQMQFVLSLEEAGEAETIEMDMLMRDGIFMLSGSLMEDLMGTAMDDVDWFGLDLNGAMDGLLKQTGISDDDLLDMPDNADHISTITRLDDAVLNGVPVAVFESVIDLDMLMADGAESMDETMVSLGVDGTISSGELTDRHYIGLNDGYTYRNEISGAINVDGFTIEGTTGYLDVAISMSMDLSAFNEPVEVELPEDVPAFPLAMMLAMGSQ